MAGLRERKRRRTFKAIHDAALRLFEERGYGAVTVADIAEAAEVSRATRPGMELKPSAISLASL